MTRLFTSADGMWWRLLAVFAVAAATLASATVAPTPAAASLSETLAEKIAMARRSEFRRNYDGALAIYEAALKMDASTPQAMRAVLKHRAELFE